MNYKNTFLFLLALFLSQNVLADNFKVNKDEIIGEWKLLATQLDENGPKYEDDGTSMVIFTKNGKVIEKSGLGSLERDFYIKDGKLFVKAPLGDGEWIIRAKSNNSMTLKTNTGILYLEKKK